MPHPSWSSRHRGQPQPRAVYVFNFLPHSPNNKTHPPPGWNGCTSQKLWNAFFTHTGSVRCLVCFIFLCVHSWKDDNSKTLRMERFLKKIPTPNFVIRSLLTLDGCGDARMQHYICSRWVGRSPYFGRPAAPGEINHCRMTHPDGRPMLPPGTSRSCSASLW